MTGYAGYNQNNTLPPQGTTVTTNAMSSAAGTAVIHLIAENIAFNMSTITVPSGAAVTIYFSNPDNGIPHNFVVYTDNSAANQIFKGATITGPSATTYIFTTPTTSGVYFFRCDVHTTQMTGCFVVTSAWTAGTSGTTMTSGTNASQSSGSSESSGWNIKYVGIIAFGYRTAVEIMGDNIALNLENAPLPLTDHIYPAHSNLLFFQAQFLSWILSFKLYPTVNLKSLTFNSLVALRAMFIEMFNHKTWPSRDSAPSAPAGATQAS